MPSWPNCWHARSSPKAGNGGPNPLAFPKRRSIDCSQNRRRRYSGTRQGRADECVWFPFAAGRAHTIFVHRGQTLWSGSTWALCLCHIDYRICRAACLTWPAPRAGGIACERRPPACPHDCGCPFRGDGGISARRCIFDHVARTDVSQQRH